MAVATKASYPGDAAQLALRFPQTDASREEKRKLFRTYGRLQFEHAVFKEKYFRYSFGFHILSADKTYFVAKIITSKLDALFQPPNSIPGEDCSIPDDWLYPLCKYRVEVR